LGEKKLRTEDWEVICGAGAGPPAPLSATA
jgi:hypothetical protein